MLEEGIGRIFQHQQQHCYDYDALGIPFSSRCVCISPQAMVTEALEMEGKVPGWRPGLIPFAKDVDNTVLVSRNSFISIVEFDLGRVFVSC